MFERYFLALLTCFFAIPVHAHGEDVLSTLYAQLFSVLATFILLVTLSALKQHLRVGVVGCLLGIALSWVITVNLPYVAHNFLITALHVILPFAFAISAVLLIKRNAK